MNKISYIVLELLIMLLPFSGVSKLPALWLADRKIKAKNASSSTDLH